MDRTTPVTVFDGHNDAIQKLHPFGDEELDRFLNGDASGHIDLKRIKEGRFGGGIFAVFVPSTSQLDAGNEPAFRLTDYGYEVRLADPISQHDVLMRSITQMSGLFRLERASGGRIKVVHTAEELERCLDNGTMGIVLHAEGAELIDENLDALEVLYRAGLRSLGITWSRPNIFGHGVPFRYPASPDTGPGLTSAGRALVMRCNELGVLLDLSHLNEQGFWDVAQLSKMPLVATHSAAHAICPATRNLTDRQLAAIRDSDGLVGVNFEVSTTRADSHDDPDTPIEVLVTQIDYLVERLGIDRVGFGSDFDGATMPNAIADVAGLPRLIDALRAHGMDEESIQKLARRNWLRVLRITWGH